MSQSPHSRSPQSPGTPSRVRELITDPANRLGALYDHARLLARLDSLLSGFFDPALAGQCKVANLREDRLILISPSASCATRIRLQSNAILDFLLESGFPQLREIEIRIAPLQQEKTESKTRRLASPAAQEAEALVARLTAQPKG